MKAAWAFSEFQKCWVVLVHRPSHFSLLPQGFTSSLRPIWAGSLAKVAGDAADAARGWVCSP